MSKGNNSIHERLDGEPVNNYAPKYRNKVAYNNGLKFRAPNNIKSKDKATEDDTWENSYWNGDGEHSNYEIDGKSVHDAVDEAEDKFREKIKSYE